MQRRAAGNHESGYAFQVLEVQEAFETQLAAEIAGALGIAASRVRVKLVSAAAPAPAAGGARRLAASAIDVTLWILGADEQATSASIMVGRRQRRRLCHKAVTATRSPW